jgi:hypothetical protein
MVKYSLLGAIALGVLFGTAAQAAPVTGLVAAQADVAKADVVQKVWWDRRHHWHGYHRWYGWHHGRRWHRW